MASNQHRINFHALGQAVAASLICAGVLGTWNSSSETTRELASLNANFATVRKDVDRHETIIASLQFGQAELQAELRAKPGAHY